MVPAMALWLPIVVSAVLVFVASSIIHMILPYHRKDYVEVPAEDDVRAALRAAAIPPGEYAIPYAATPKAMQDRDLVAKMVEGPVALLTVTKNGPPVMGKILGQWFAYCLVVGLFTAYLTGLAHGPGADYMAVFRAAGATAFTAYTLALWQSSIWFGRKWSTTLKSTFDGFVYALLTAGVFGWLWP